MPQINVTVVFEKNWDAINERLPNGDRKYRYVIHEGSSRSSKTHSLVQFFYLYALQSAGKRLSVWRDTKKSCKDTVGYDMTKVFPTMPNYFSMVKFNKHEGIYYFLHKKGGGDLPTTLELCGTDDEEKVHGYNGNVLWVNEPYKISKETFNHLDQRTEDVVLIDWNPKKSHWINDLKKDERTLVIHSTFMNNPFCPPEERRKILSYQPVKMSQLVLSKTLSEGEAKEYDMAKNPKGFDQELIDELSLCRINEGKNSADEFNWKVYGLGVKAERPNRIFNWTSIPLQEYLNLECEVYYGVDWGVVDPWGIIEVKYYDGALYVRELNYASENDWLTQMSPTQRQQVQGEEEGLVKYVFEKLHIPQDKYIICDNNRPLKVRALREAGYDYAITATKGQGSIIDGISLLTKLKVYYTEDSKNLEDEQEVYSRKVDRYGKVLEEPEDADNHTMDGLRYIATRLQIEGIIKVI